MILLRTFLTNLKFKFFQIWLDQLRKILDFLKRGLLIKLLLLT